MLRFLPFFQFPYQKASNLYFLQCYLRVTENWVGKHFQTPRGCGKLVGPSRSATGVTATGDSERLARLNQYIGSPPERLPIRRARDMNVRILSVTATPNAHDSSPIFSPAQLSGSLLSKYSWWQPAHTPTQINVNIPGQNKTITQRETRHTSYFCSEYINIICSNCDRICSRLWDIQC